jgi:hypothetical protein
VESVPKRTLGRDGQKPSKSGKQKVHFLQGSGARAIFSPTSAFPRCLIETILTDLTAQSVTAAQHYGYEGEVKVKVKRGIYVERKIMAFV